MMANFFQFGENEMSFNSAANENSPSDRNQALSTSQHNFNNPLPFFHPSVYGYPGPYNFVTNPYFFGGEMYSSMLHEDLRPDLRSSSSLQHPYPGLTGFLPYYSLGFQLGTGTPAVPNMYGLTYYESISSNTGERPSHANVTDYQTPRNIMEYRFSENILRYQSTETMRYYTTEGVRGYGILDRPTDRRLSYVLPEEQNSEIENLSITDGHNLESRNQNSFTYIKNEHAEANRNEEKNNENSGRSESDNNSAIKQHSHEDAEFFDRSQNVLEGSVLDFSVRKSTGCDKFNKSNYWKQINECEAEVIDLSIGASEERIRRRSPLSKCPRQPYTNYSQINTVSTLPSTSDSATTVTTKSTTECPYDSAREENIEDLRTLKHEASQNFDTSRKSSSTNTDNFDFRLQPMGYEILSDPITGKILLIPATSIDTLRRTLFWPRYQPSVFLSISDNTSEKNNVTSVKREDCFIVERKPSSGSSTMQEKNQTKAPRNWLIEKTPSIPNKIKEEAAGKLVDVTGLEILNRGIEKIEKETSGITVKSRRFEALCELAGRRITDEFVEDKESIPQTKKCHSDNRIEVMVDTGDNTGDKLKFVQGMPKKITSRREEILGDLSKVHEMSPPILEKATDFQFPVRNDSTADSEVEILDPPVLSPHSTNEECVARNECNKSNYERRAEDSKKGESRISSVSDKSECCGIVSVTVTETKDTGEKQVKDNSNSEELMSTDEHKTVKPVKRTKVKKVPKSSTLLHTGSVEIASTSRKRKRSSSKQHQKYLKKKRDIKSRKNAKEYMSNFDPNKMGVYTIVHSDDSSSELPPETNIEKFGGEGSLKVMRKDLSRREEGKSGKRKKLIIKLRRNKNFPFEYNLVEEEEKKKNLNKFVFTCISPIKILTVENGLFYRGQLCAVQFPDIYGITIDGERGNRPHIFSREDVLKNSILEVKPQSAKELKPGDRICAYWSNQYRSLYPGVVSSSFHDSEEPQENSVVVAFDDGDCCQINVGNIRYLPQLYPITDCNRNPLQNFTKKKRRGGVENDDSSNSILISQIGAMKMSTGEKSLSQIISVEGMSQKRNPSPSKKKSCKRKHQDRHKIERTNAATVDMVQDSTKIFEDALNVTPNSLGVAENIHAVTINEKRKNKKSVDTFLESLIRYQEILWTWSGKSFRRAGIKGKARREYYRTIQRGKEKISVGECAVFLSTGRPDRPFIGRIESMWQTWGANKVVRVKWFYHPEETVGCPAVLEYPGALFESPHADENDIQTISHKCEVLPLKRYIERLGKAAGYQEGNTKLFYLAGYYDPTNTSLSFQEGVRSK